MVIYKHKLGNVTELIKQNQIMKTIKILSLGLLAILTLNSCGTIDIPVYHSVGVEYNRPYYQQNRYNQNNGNYCGGQYDHREVVQIGDPRRRAYGNGLQTYAGW